MSSELMEIMQLAEERGVERGRTEGIQQGIERGRTEGIQQGIERGRTEGMQQGAIKIIIKQFNDKKISANEAAEYLDISVDEFLKLV